MLCPSAKPRGRRGTTGAHTWQVLGRCAQVSRRLKTAPGSAAAGSLRPAIPPAASLPGPQSLAPQTPRAAGSAAGSAAQTGRSEAACLQTGSSNNKQQGWQPSVGLLKQRSHLPPTKPGMLVDSWPPQPASQPASRPAPQPPPAHAPVIMMRRRLTFETRRRRVVREALRFFSACASSMIRWLQRHFSRKPRSRRCSGLHSRQRGGCWFDPLERQNCRPALCTSPELCPVACGWLTANAPHYAHKHSCALPAPVTLKQCVAGEHNVEGGGLAGRVNVPLWRRLVGLQLSILPRLLAVNVKLVVCSGGKDGNIRQGVLG